MNEDLPFNRAQLHIWRSVTLPSVIDYLGSQIKCWDISVLSELQEIVQENVDCTLPDAGHVVKPKGPTMYLVSVVVLRLPQSTES